MNSLSASLNPANRFRGLLPRFVGHGDLRAVFQSALQVFAIRFIGAGLTYASMVLLARWLGTFNFGIYAYVFVIVTFLGLALSLAVLTVSPCVILVVSIGGRHANISAVPTT